MTFEFLTKYPLIHQWIIGRLGYYASGCFEFRNETLVTLDSTNKKNVFIVAKAHYSETWKTFSAINKAELNKLLALSKASNKEHLSIYQVVENKSIDGFEVKTITFDEEIYQSLGKGKILIPETELLHNNQDKIIDVITPKGQLFTSFIGNKISSAYAKGLVANINTYKLTAGLSSDAQVRHVSKAEFPPFLLSRVMTIPLNQLFKKSLAEPKEWINFSRLHWLYGAPLLTAVVFYLCTNAYLAFSIHNIESSLSEGGERVSSVLNHKREIDKKSNMLNELSGAFGQQVVVHRYWDIVHELLEHGATITRITLRKGELTIRGTADKASTILAEISEHQLVKSASFNGPVRSSRGKDSFVLKIVPKEQL